jgi:hypothetical protein
MSGSLDRALAAIAPPEFDINFGEEPADTATVSLGYDFSYDLAENHSIALDPLFDLPPDFGNQYQRFQSHQSVGPPNVYWERQQARTQAFLNNYQPESLFGTASQAIVSLDPNATPEQIENAAQWGEIGDAALLGTTGSRGRVNASRSRRIGGGAATPPPPNAGLLTGPSQGELNARGGLEFEAAVRESLRAPKGTSLFYSTDTRVGTIPDLPIETRFGVTEFKNEIKLSMDSQFRTQLQAADQAKVPFNLVISPRTQTISRPLQREIFARNGRIFQYDPVTDKFSNVVTLGNRVVR